MTLATDPLRCDDWPPRSAAWLRPRLEISGHDRIVIVDNRLDAALPPSASRSGARAPFRASKRASWPFRAARPRCLSHARYAARGDLVAGPAGMTSSCGGGRRAGRR